MGWWSTDTLGGDTPLDWLASFEDVLDVEDLYPLDSIAEPASVKAAVEAREEDLIAAIGEGEPDDESIGWQVLGALAASVGAQLQAQTYERIEWAISEDGWARTDRGRAHDMAELARSVNASRQGSPTPVPTTGLFQALAEKMGVMRMGGL